MYAFSSYPDIWHKDIFADILISRVYCKLTSGLGTSPLQTLARGALGTPGNLFVFN